MKEEVTNTTGGIEGKEQPLGKKGEVSRRKKKKDDAAWVDYVENFQNEVLSQPTVERFQEATDGFNAVCLLCYEKIADRCHRRLLAEHFKRHLPELDIQHL